MKQDKNVTPSGVSRRTVVKGAAWAVPAITVASAVPAVAQSECVVEFRTTADSRKCCNGPVKNMKLVFEAVDINNCLDDTAQICVTGVALGNGQDPGTVVLAGACGGIGDPLTVYLVDTKSCTVNLLVSYSVNGQAAPEPAEVKSDNIPGGNTDGECVPPPAT